MKSYIWYTIKKISGGLYGLLSFGLKVGILYCFVCECVCIFLFFIFVLFDLASLVTVEFLMGFQEVVFLPSRTSFSPHL